MHRSICCFPWSCEREKKMKNVWIFSLLSEQRGGKLNSLNTLMCVQNFWSLSRLAWWVDRPVVKVDNPPWLTPHVFSCLIEFYMCFQIADQLPWISLTPQESFAWRWKHWSQNWPALSVWSCLKTRCCCLALTASASTARTASWSPTAPPTSQWSLSPPSSARPAAMSSPSASAV